MQAVTGVFSSKADAEQAVAKLKSSGLHIERVTLLAPGTDVTKQVESVPVDTTEQPGFGKVFGAVAGGGVGLTAGLVVAVLPGVGPVLALGILGAAILTAAGATVGAIAGQSFENALSQGLPEDEIFVYEDALRRGRSVVIALAEDEAGAEPLRTLLKAAGAEAVDAAREEWWIGLRDAEHEHYLASGKNFANDEKFYRMGFEAAQHARTRCMEFDQVSAEMESDLEELQKKYPGVDLAEPFTRGYQRGRDYYQRLCDESKAA
jgi:hypothetical protein